MPSTKFTVMRKISNVTDIAGYLAGVNGDSAAREGSNGSDRIRGDGGQDRIEVARDGTPGIREFGDWSEGGRVLPLGFGGGAVLRVLSEGRIRPLMTEAIEIA